MIHYLKVKNPVGRRKLHGRMEFRGLSISIENAKSSSRQWYNPDVDKYGISRMDNHYGYVQGTLGVDGDAVDVYVGQDKDSDMVYIVHQKKAPDFTEYDEDKCFLAFASEEAVRESYLKCYDDPRFLGPITAMPFEEFKEKLATHKGKMIKSHIKEHLRHTKGGGVAVIKEHEDSRSKKTEAPAFKEWFGESKVTDSKGEPLIVYHGTREGADFNTFDTRRTKDKLGTYFTHDPKAASDIHGGRKQILPVYLRIEKPLDTRGMDKNELVKLVGITAMAHDVKVSHHEKVTYTLLEWLDRKGDLVPKLKRKGYDGIIFDGDHEGITYVTFSPSQIKSATGNSGGFDRSNPDIRKSHIQSYTRTTATGKTVFVNEHEDKRRVYIPDNSNHRDNNGNVPVIAPSGRDNFGSIQGEIAAKIGLPPGPIKLLQGKQVADHKGFGKAHMHEQHGAEIRAAGFKDEEAFVADVVKNYSAIYDAGGGRYALVSDGAKQKVHILEISRNKVPPFYSIITGYITDRPKFTERNFKLLWKKGGLRKGFRIYMEGLPPFLRRHDAQLILRRQLF